MEIKQFVIKTVAALLDRIFGRRIRSCSTYSHTSEQQPKRFHNVEDVSRLNVRGMRMRDGPKGMTCSSAERGSLGILCETKFGNLAVREIVVMGVRYHLFSQFKSLFFNSSLFVNISTQQEHINCKFVVEVPRNTVQREVPRQLGNCYEPQSQEFQQPLFDYWSVRLGQMWDRFAALPRSRWPQCFQPSMSRRWRQPIFSFANDTRGNVECGASWA